LPIEKTPLPARCRLNLLEKSLTIRRSTRGPKVPGEIQILVGRNTRKHGLASVPIWNLYLVMADERWEELAEREGIDYAKTVAEIAGLKGLNADKEADRKAFRREILERVLQYKKS